MMANNNYWQDRAIELEKKTHQISKDGYDELVPEFDKAKKEIQAKIDTWLARIADNNNVSLERAKEMLDNKELNDFKMDINEYIQYGMENELDQRWMKELENASAKHHIEKLTALKMQVEAEYQKVFAKEEQVVSDTIKEAYKDRYYRTAYEIESAFKLENTIGTINEKKLNNIINKPWAADGSNFSDRIWIKKDQMVDNLYKELVRELVSGESLKNAIDSMTRFVDSENKNAKYCAARLIQTEAAYFSSKSQQECYNDLDVEEYEIVATLDNNTSDICQGMDGQHFKMSEYEAGVTAPPFHVFCRSTTCPYFNDEFSYGTRAARGVDGKSEVVDKTLTYKEWFKEVKEPYKTNTYEWLTGNKSGKVEISQSIAINGKIRNVDNQNIIQDHTKREKEIAELIAQNSGLLVKLMPRITGIYQGIQSSDLLINNDKYDIKGIEKKATSELNAVFNAINKKDRQANNFVIDIRDTKLTIENIIEQSKNIFKRDKTKFVKNLLIVKNDKIIVAFRKK